MERDLALADPGSPIVLSYPGDPDRFFYKIFVWPFVDGTCWVSIGGWYCVAGQANRLQIVVNLGQIKVIWSLVDIVFADVTLHVQLSRVADVGTGSRSALPTSEV